MLDVPGAGRFAAGTGKPAAKGLTALPRAAACKGLP